jgi:PadR family transcriptional regulator, regulatory protein PadR
MRHARGHRSRARHRQLLETGEYEVQARVERFGEAALLLLLAERPTHGYELLEQLPGVVGAERVDVGNLYRALRALEHEGLVTSEWNADLPGPAKRTYSLTDAGRSALAAWLSALAALREELTRFLDRADQEGGDHVPSATSPRSVASSEP